MGENGNRKIERLAQQLAEKTAIIDGISDILMLLDAKTYKILEVNQAFLNSYGFSRDDVLGKNCYEATHHLEVPCHLANNPCPCPLVDTAQTGKFSYAEHGHRDQYGSTHYFEITTYPIKDANGRVDRIVHLSRDITMKKELENQVRKSEGKYRTIFNFMPNPLFVLDEKNLEIIDCNSCVTSVYGYTRDELAMTPFMNLFEKEARERYESELRRFNVLNQVRQNTKNGQTIYVNISVSPSEYLGKGVLIVCATDITERLMVEQQLIQASKMATLGEMATGVAHELNQPLSVIKTASSFLLKKATKKEVIKDEILKTLAQEIEGHVDRASRVISHMREFGRKSEIAGESVQVNETLNKAIQIFSQQLKLREIEIIKEFDEDIPAILANSNRLEQVFINLLINARDSIEEKWKLCDHKSADKKIFLKTSSKDENVTIEIRDTGTGIPKSILDKIFEPFFTTKEVGKGTGLGLSISYSIVQDYYGTISVESEEGEGSRFILRFPVLEKA